MAYTNDGKAVMLNALKAVITHVGLLNESDVEISGGSYARDTISWGTVSGGSVSASDQPSFSVPASTTVSQVIFMSAATSGTEYARADVTNETFTNAGTYTLTSVALDLNAV